MNSAAVNTNVLSTTEQILHGEHGTNNNSQVHLQGYYNGTLQVQVGNYKMLFLLSRLEEQVISIDQLEA